MTKVLLGLTTLGVPLFGSSLAKFTSGPVGGAEVLVSSTPVVDPLGTASPTTWAAQQCIWTPSTSGSIVAFAKKAFGVTSGDPDGSDPYAIISISFRVNEIRARLNNTVNWANYLGPNFFAGKDVPVSYSVGQSYNLRVEHRGTLFLVYVDDALVAQWEDGRMQGAFYYGLNANTTVSDISGYRLLSLQPQSDLTWNYKWPTFETVHKSAPLLTGGSQGLPNRFLFWTVRDVTGEISPPDPTKPFVVLTSSDHSFGADAGIYVAWAEDRELNGLTNFTQALTTTEGNGQLETPDIYWDAANSRYILFAHLGDYPSAATQSTVTYLTTDFLTFTDFQPAINTTGFDGFNHTGYITLYELDGTLYLAGLGQNRNIDEGIIYNAQWFYIESTDKRNFVPHKPAQILDARTNQKPFLTHGRVFEYNDELWLVTSVGISAEQSDDSWAYVDRFPAIYRVDPVTGQLSARRVEPLSDRTAWMEGLVSSEGISFDAASQTLYLYVLAKTFLSGVGSGEDPNAPSQLGILKCVLV